MQTHHLFASADAIPYISARAEECFGDHERAEHWLRRPTAALDGASPLSLLGSAEGIRRVEALLAAIDHGLAT